MNATDRIREDARWVRSQRMQRLVTPHPSDEVYVLLEPDTAEALCDLVDVCREHQGITDALATEQRGPDELTKDEAERVAALTERQRAALARLDAE